MSDLKSRQLFDQPLQTDGDERELTAQQQFTGQENFVPTAGQQAETEAEMQLEQVIRPKRRKKWRVAGLLCAFLGLVTWQAVDHVVTSVRDADWLSLGWAGFLSVLAGAGMAAFGKELWKLRTLRRHFSVQEQAQAMMEQDAVGQAQSFCEALANRSGINPRSAAYERWRSSVDTSHSDAEILDMYDAMVVGEQDRQASQLVSQYATEAAALVAVSPLALADMLLVAWRNFKMIDQLADVYGIELGYWSRLQLFKAVLVNMAAAGASELVMDASMDLLSMDLAAKLSARAGQGLGVGILTARLGLKAMALLRPLPWHQDRAVRLGAIRRHIIAKISALTLK